MSPFLVNVMGLKKSGKTTVTEAIVATLRSKGFSVGTVKSMVRSSFSLDVEGKDTWRHSRAGADFVVSLSRGETVYIESHKGGRKGFADIGRLIPSATQFIVCEGLEDRTVEQVQICCLRSMEDLGRTIEVRGIEGGPLIAISGLVASTGEGHATLPVFDVMDRLQREGLVGLLLERMGNPSPDSMPSGPLIEDPDWRPGVLLAGEFPDVNDDIGNGGHG